RLTSWSVSKCSCDAKTSSTIVSRSRVSRMPRVARYSRNLSDGLTATETVASSATVPPNHFLEPRGGIAGPLLFVQLQLFDHAVDGQLELFGRFVGAGFDRRFDLGQPLFPDAGCAAGIVEHF